MVYQTCSQWDLYSVNEGVTDSVYQWKEKVRGSHKGGEMEDSKEWTQERETIKISLSFSYSWHGIVQETLIK